MTYGKGNSDNDLPETSILLFGGTALVCTCFCTDLWQNCGKPGMCADSWGVLRWSCTIWLALEIWSGVRGEGRKCKAKAKQVREWKNGNEGKRCAKSGVVHRLHCKWNTLFNCCRRVGLGTSVCHETNEFISAERALFSLLYESRDIDSNVSKSLGLAAASPGMTWQFLNVLFYCIYQYR